MKNIFLAFSFLVAAQASASIEYTGEDQAKPTATQIQRNRSCFKELEMQGCGDPGEEPEHFRSCMSEVFPKLTNNCQTMMNNLYGTK